jgi:ABC-type nitrate/sulfonate/bicarbonate transport system substrate-binding protein
LKEEEMTRMHGRLLGVAAAAMVVALAVAGCSSGGSNGGSSAGAGGTQTVRLGAGTAAGYSASTQMPALGKKNGLDVQVTNYPSSSDRSIALISGRLDVAFIGWTDLAKLVSQGRDLVAIASNFEGGRPIIARTGSGIHSVKDLVGKKVAYSIGSMVDLDMHAELAARNIPFEKVAPANMTFDQMPIALQSGAIDAYYGAEPQGSQSIVSGAGYLLQSSTDVPYGAINVAVVTTKNYLKNNSATLSKFLRTYVAATKSLTSDKTLFTQVLKNNAKITDPKVIDSTLADLKLTYSLDGYQARVDDLIQAELRLGLIKKAPKASDLIDTSFSSVLK